MSLKCHGRSKYTTLVYLIPFFCPLSAKENVYMKIEYENSLFWPFLSLKCHGRTQYTK
jgi:hypothetical protein